MGCEAESEFRTIGRHFILVGGDMQAHFKCWMGEVVRGPEREGKNEMERDLPRDIVVSLD